MTTYYRLSFTKNYRFISLLFLSVITLSVYTFVDQFQLIGDELLLNAQFDSDFSYWHISQKTTQADLIKVERGQLFVSSDSSVVTISQILSVPEGQFVRVSANAAVMNILAGEKGWQKARLYLVNQINGKSFWGQKHHLFSLDRTEPLTFYQEEFSIHPLAEKLKIGIQVPKGGGTLVVDNLSVSVVEKATQFQYLSRFLMFLWVIALIWIVYPLLSGVRGRFILVGGLVVLTLMVVPHDIKTDITHSVVDVVQKELPVELTITHTNGGQFEFLPFPVSVSKLGHFLVFFLFTLAVALFRKRLDLRAFLLLSGFAAMTEILQVFSINRQASMIDYGINFLGILLASLLIFLLKKLKEKSVVDSV